MSLIDLGSMQFEIETAGRLIVSLIIIATPATSKSATASAVLKNFCNIGENHVVLVLKFFLEVFAESSIANASNRESFLVYNLICDVILDELC